MRATQILSEEHRLIERGLAVGRAMARRLRQGLEVNPDDLLELLDFCAGFADGHHHAKEEDLLFPWMESQGMSATMGPLACMRAEHDQGREMIRFVREKTPDLPATAADAAQGLEAFAEHLQAHIFKEDNILFPMADRLGDGDDQLLPAYAEKIPDADVVEAGYRRSIERLEAAYPGVAVPEVKVGVSV